MASQVFPLQQGWPLPPQFTQRPPLHAAPLLQNSVMQQGCPGAPQGTQRPAEQVVLPLHPWPQQGCPLPPQATQDPALHVLPVLQVSPAQQGCPRPPHATQVPAAQADPVSHALLAQHRSPRPPHPPQTPATHAPTVQALPSQQGCPSPPQGAQVFDAQRWPVTQKPIAQQG